MDLPDIHLSLMFPKVIVKEWPEGERGNHREALWPDTSVPE